MVNIDFKPHVLIRNKHVQTLISSSKPPRAGEMIKHAKPMNIYLQLDEKIHLTGAYSPQTKAKSKGLIILLHGWLGSIESTYMLSRGEKLYQEGFSIFRLNLRDHGDTSALNEGLFHGCRLEEIYQAIKTIAPLEPESDIILIGFSMGGSFALRTGWRNSIDSSPLKQLKKIIAICPSVDPEAVALAIDSSKIYGPYFCSKWRNNLLEKERLFPQAYQFGNILNLSTCVGITGALVKKYSDYPDIDAYFTEYQFSPEKLGKVNIPMTIITAEDDPVIPVDSFKELDNINPLLSLYITSYGGHVGFVSNLAGDSWLDGIMPTLVKSK